MEAERRYNQKALADPREWLNQLLERYRTELQTYMAEHAALEALTVEIGAAITEEKIDQLMRQYRAEGQALERYRDAQRDYIAFLQYMKKSGLLL